MNRAGARRPMGGDNGSLSGPNAYDDAKRKLGL